MKLEEKNTSIIETEPKKFCDGPALRQSSSVAFLKRNFLFIFILFVSGLGLSGCTIHASIMSLLPPPTYAPVVSDISLTSFTQEAESATITLPYTDADNDLATHCTVSALSHVTVSQACSCSAGVCTLKVTGAAGYIGSASFAYTVDAGGEVSNIATATLSITPDTLDNEGTTTLGFAAGSNIGTQWDSSGAYLRLDQSLATNYAEMDATWAPQWASLEAYWKVNNDWVDSKGSNDGVAVTTTSFSNSAKIGSHAAVFSGAERFDIPLNLTTGSYTFSTWSKSSMATTVLKYFLDADDAGARFIIGYQGNSAGKLGYHVNGFWIDVADTPLDNNWHYLTWVFDGVGSTAEIFIDGVSVGTGPYTAKDLKGLIRIGGHSTDGGCFECYIGSLDEIAIWSTALTASEIQEIYARQSAKYAGEFKSRVMNYGSSTAWSGLTWLTTLPFGKELTGDANASGTITISDSESHSNYPSLVGSTGATTDDNLMSGLAGLWHLNEMTMNSAPSGNDFEDKSGNANHGAETGGVALETFGKFGRAARFDGTDDHIIVADAASLNPTASVSISLWLRPSALTTGVLVQKWGHTGPAADQYFLWLNSGVPTFSVNQSNATNRSTSGGTLIRGVWNHLVAVADATSGNITLYLNGEQVSTNTYNSTLATGGGTPMPLVLGVKLNESLAVVGGNSFAGAMDEVAIWGRGLHVDEVKQLYRRGANRLKAQVRSCTMVDCSDDPQWLGSDNTKASYFSELHNYARYNLDVNNCAATNLILTGSLNLNFACFTGGLSNLTSQRYFQYRMILESDDSSSNCDYGSGATWCSPELKSLEAKP